MLPVELIFLTAKILDLPPVAPAHVAGLVLLREAFARADFKIGKDIPAEMKGLTFYLGGFEMLDPATDSVLRVMSMFGHSMTKAPSMSGLAYTWAVTSELEHMRTLPADRRDLLTREMRLHLITPLELAVLDADMVLQRFEGVMAAPDFLATPAEAADFAAQLTEAVTP